jgi:hypothetical protein
MFEETGSRLHSCRFTLGTFNHGVQGSNPCGLTSTIKDFCDLAPWKAQSRYLVGAGSAFRTWQALPAALVDHSPSTRRRCSPAFCRRCSFRKSRTSSANGGDRLRALVNHRNHRAGRVSSRSPDPLASLDPRCSNHSPEQSIPDQVSSPVR